MDTETILGEHVFNLPSKEKSCDTKIVLCVLCCVSARALERVRVERTFLFCCVRFGFTKFGLLTLSEVQQRQKCKVQVDCRLGVGCVWVCFGVFVSELR